MPTKPEQAPPVLFEVVTRKPNGHETCPRVWARDHAEASATVAAAALNDGSLRAEIVDVRQP
jgi:hypothetical protein